MTKYYAHVARRINDAGRAILRRITTLFRECAYDIRREFETFFNNNNCAYEKKKINKYDHRP